MSFSDAVDSIDIRVTNSKLERLLTALDAKEADALRELLKRADLSAGKVVRIIREEGANQSKVPQDYFKVSDKTIYRWRDDHEVPRKAIVTGL